MKHLLILFSFLLLSSPVIGDNHKGETLYLWETSSGYVWRGFGEKGTHPIYKGDVKNGVPNGVGILIYGNGGKTLGEWKNGKQNGQGTFTYSDGSKYIGTFRNGQRHGEGNHTFVNGDKYIGELNYELKHGQGTFIYANGDKYIGEYYNNMRHGEGIYLFANGIQQKGIWRDGIFIKEFKQFQNTKFEVCTGLFFHKCKSL